MRRGGRIAEARVILDVREQLVAGCRIERYRDVRVADSCQSLDIRKLHNAVSRWEMTWLR
jgi:hypothetical protein